MALRVVRPSTVRDQRGGTFLGFLVGLIAGLSISVVVAMFVTRAPMPFLHKDTRSSEDMLESKALSEAPDPNVPLHAKLRPAEEAGAGAAAAPSVASAPSSAVVAAPSGGVADAQGEAIYLLQAGAFRSSSEAENMKVRLALIGFEARVLDARVNGQTLYRVRVGPYAQLDSMNRARARLAESGIEASVVRQR